MAITEAQLVTWSHQGAITQSKDTYGTVMRALESDRVRYTSRRFNILLQGSYGNDTNVYAESDVDVVICLDATFHPGLDDLNSAEKAAFHSAHPDSATYTRAQFKAHVITALEAAFPRAVTPGNKAIKIAASGNRRRADVVAAGQYRRYYSFPSTSGASYAKGICFFKPGGTQIVNYPRQHSDNCTAKHQATNRWFKPTVRILKNLRRAMVNDGIIDKIIAPSYFLEGLLYNVPDEKYGGSYQDTLVSCINWISEASEADRSKFVCANKQFFLFGTRPETWPVAHYDQFMNAFVDYWKD